MSGRIILADNLDVLPQFADESVDLIYVDPPFNTGKHQTLTRLRTSRDADGDRVGFGGYRYRSEAVSVLSYLDVFDDFLAFLEPRLRHFWRILKGSGTLYVHLDYREVHYCKVLLDAIFGRACFLNEIVWSYDYGGRTRRRWPPKHDTILVYVKNRRGYYFDAGAADRIPYMAPGLVGPAKAATGKLPTDSWWHTIVPPGGKERTGYPTQKPLGIVRRIVAVSSPPGGLVADFFAGSGTTGAAAAELGRSFVLVDNNADAVQITARRLAAVADLMYEGFEPGA